MEFVVKNKNFSVVFAVENHGIGVKCGSFYDVELVQAPLFKARIKNVNNGEEKKLTSLEHWDKVWVKEYGKERRFYFDSPFGIADFRVLLIASVDETGITWKTDVLNENAEWSVIEITYPTPSVSGDPLHVFTPDGCGREIKNAGKRDYQLKMNYPSHNVSMMYTAAYGENGGIYLGVHDERGAVKRMEVVTESSNIATFDYIFWGINASRGANAFSPYGVCRWEAFLGDWYDATLIYKVFVETKANWLPQKGRPDTAQKFKDVPFWIMDGLPNSEAQGDNRPRLLSPDKGEAVPDDHWYKAPIALKNALGTPVAYHVYNWHEITFNINYPHYIPAKKAYFEGAKALNEAGVYIMPYINAVSWENKDQDEGYEMNFENTGKYGALMLEDGTLHGAVYPQYKATGEATVLASMCPGFAPWHKVIADVAREIEATMGVSGIYFDEIAAKSGEPCFNPEHNHLPGGGDCWTQQYHQMMEAISFDKPDESFYFTESNGEPFVHTFDGMLTWTWVHDSDVPAFPLLYAGYVQMLGRITDGAKKKDTNFFRYFTAKSMLYGQQMGWMNSRVVYDENRLPYLKNLVTTRYQYTEMFNTGTLLRPAKVTCSQEEIVTSATLWFTDDIHMEQALTGTWDYPSKNCAVLFLVNVSENDNECSLSFSVSEYGVDKNALPKEFEVTGDTCSFRGVLKGGECRVWELNK